MITIAKDVKIQVEAQDFNDDKKDAGEIGGPQRDRLLRGDPRRSQVGGARNRGRPQVTEESAGQGGLRNVP